MPKFRMMNSQAISAPWILAVSTLTTTAIAAVAAVIAAGINVGANWFHARGDEKRARSDEKRTRVAVARQLHAELIGTQSALVRAILRHDWWLEGEMLPSEMSYSDMAPLIAAMGSLEWGAVARAIGWVRYVREVTQRHHKEDERGPSEEMLAELGEIFEWLEVARYALAHEAGDGFRYQEYQCRNIVKSVFAEPANALGRQLTREQLSELAPTSLTADAARQLIENPSTVNAGP